MYLSLSIFLFKNYELKISYKPLFQIYLYMNLFIKK